MSYIVSSAHAMKRSPRPLVTVWPALEIRESKLPSSKGIGDLISVHMPPILAWLKFRSATMTRASDRQGIKAMLLVAITSPPLTLDTVTYIRRAQMDYEGCSGALDKITAPDGTEVFYYFNIAGFTGPQREPLALKFGSKVRPGVQVWTRGLVEEGPSRGQAQVSPLLPHRW